MMIVKSVADETKEKQEVKKAEEGTAPAPAKPKAAAKAPAKPLLQLMEEDIIPSLKSTLEAQQDISLSFDENKVG